MFVKLEPHTDFAAVMTSQQFRALGERITLDRVAEQIPASKLFSSAKASLTADRDLVRRWLINGWNTEHIMVKSSTVLEEAGGAALQWTFPQAYYAVFASTLAFFKACGKTQSSHRQVIKHFGELAGPKYPQALSFVARGTKRKVSFGGLARALPGTPSLSLDTDDPRSVDQQIRQFLKSTRGIDLGERKKTLKLKTKSGKKLKSYREEHWKQVADSLGPTSLLSLLYRKRIKANYRDIETFTVADFDPNPIFDALVRIVSATSLFHEILVGKALGRQWLREVFNNYLESCESSSLESRRSFLNDLVK